METLLPSDHKGLRNFITVCRALEGHLINAAKSAEKMLELQKLWSQSYDTCPPLLEHACNQLHNLFMELVAPGLRDLSENIKLQRKSFQQLLEAERRLDSIEGKLDSKRKQVQRNASSIRFKEENLTNASSNSLDKKKLKQKQKKLLKRKESLSKLESEVDICDTNYNTERLRTRQMRLDSFHYTAKAISNSNSLFAKRLLLTSQAQQRILECVPVTPPAMDESSHGQEHYRRLGDIVNEARQLWEQPGGVAVRCLCDCHEQPSRPSRPLSYHPGMSGSDPSAPPWAYENLQHSHSDLKSNENRSRDSKSHHRQSFYPTISMRSSLKIPRDHPNNPFGFATQYSPDAKTLAQSFFPWKSPS